MGEVEAITEYVCERLEASDSTSLGSSGITGTGRLIGAMAKGMLSSGKELRLVSQERPKYLRRVTGAGAYRVWSLCH